MRIDLCCGAKKRVGAVGIDMAPGIGVDIVHNLNKFPWPVETSSADDIVCEHGIEHVLDVVVFMKECYRILKPNSSVTIVTPHFSSSNSCADPTHLRHLSAFWFKPFLSDGYLSSADLNFELVETKVTFGKGLGSKFAQFLVRLRGLQKWEKSWAFLYPGMDIKTVLRAKK